MLPRYRKAEQAAKSVSWAFAKRNGAAAESEVFRSYLFNPAAKQAYQLLSLSRKYAFP